MVKDKKKRSDFSEGIISGNAITKMSAIILGFGNIVNKQIVKGLIFLGFQISYIYYMITFGLGSLMGLTNLGTRVQEEVFNDAKQIYEYMPGDNSMLMLLYGIITIFITLAFIMTLVASVKSAHNVELKKASGRKIPTFLDDLRSLKEENLHKALLFAPITGIIVFTIIPLVFMISIAFTNYDRAHQPPGNLFGWVGFTNFVQMFSIGGKLSKTFWPVLGWTLIWAVFATITCYIFGTLLAMLINRDETKGKGFWRFVFVLSIAMPQFVSLLTMRTLFNANGPVNALLRNIGLIGPGVSVPFLTSPTMAKITIICVNIWIGVPFTMLTATGILQNIPKDLFEAAKLDGATPFKIFTKITMPYLLFVTTPTLITTFAGNINNFNVIFLLSGGGPETLDYHHAGKTDLLVTWLYKLTITNKDYNIGAVIGILVFIILAGLSILTFRNTTSYKDEGAFQ